MLNPSMRPEKKESDKEFENWVKEGFFEKKGFLR